MSQTRSYHRVLLGVFVSAMAVTVASVKNAYAIDLVTPFSVENTQVLPKGVKNPRFINLFMAGDSRFNGVGGVEPLGNKISKTVSWNDVLGSQATEVEKNVLKATLRDSNMNSSAGPGNTSGSVYTFADVKVPALAMGVSDRITLAVAVPIFNVSVNADAGFIKSDDGQKWLNHVCNISVDDCNTASRKLNNAVNEKLTRLGYEPVQSKSVTNIGDVQVIGKYVVYQNPNHALVTKSTVVLPTGIAPNADKAIDIPTGDGRLQVGGTLIYDRFLPSDFRWNSFGGVLALMPNKMDRRIPNQAEDSLSQDKENLTRNLGGLFSAGTSFHRQIPSIGFTAGVGYHFQYLTQTHFSGGSAYSAERYGYLDGLFPSQTLHAAVVSAGFSTVDWYKSKKFFYPFQANFVYSHPFVGRSTNATDAFAGELVLFF